jgi:hypothetical protein
LYRLEIGNGAFYQFIVTLPNNLPSIDKKDFIGGWFVFARKCLINYANIFANSFLSAIQ